MAASAGTVTLDLDANSVKLIRELQKAQNQTRRSSRGMTRDMSSALQKIGRQAALFGAAIVGATALIVRNQAKQIDALGKTSDAIGITTENLQTLRTMADLAGVGAEGLDKRLQKMQRTIGEIARKGGDLELALTNVGLSIKDVIDLPADEQLIAISKALTGEGNAAIRASIANDLFGRDAAKMLKLTDQLAKEGLAGMRAELEQLGFLISRSESAGVERMNDSMALAKKVSGGLAQQFTVALAPGIAAIAEEFIDAAKEGDGFGDDVRAAAEGVIKSMFFVADVVDSAGRAFKILGNVGIIAFETLKVGASGLADSIINGPNRAVNVLLRNLDLLGNLPFFESFRGIDTSKIFQFGDITGAFKNDLEISKGIIAEALAEINNILLKPLPSSGLEERLKKIREELANFKAETGTADGGGDVIIDPKAAAEIEKANAALADLFQQVQLFGATDRDKALLKIIDTGATEEQIAQAGLILDELANLQAVKDRMDQADKDRNDLEQEYAALIQNTRTESEQQAAAIDRIIELYKAGLIPNSEEFQDILRRTKEGFKEAEDQVSELNEFMIQAARNTQNIIADSLKNSFDGGFKGIIRGFGEMLRDLVAQAAAAQIGTFLFGDFGKTNKIGGLIGRFFGGGKAAGGPIDSGRAFLVGERGPEIIVPRGAGTVIPNNRLGGNSVVVNIDARESDNPGRLLALVPLIQSQIEQSITLKRRRGFA